MRLAEHTDQEGSHMGIIGWIIFGLIVGVVAKLLTPGRDPGGFIVTIILGILGAVLGGYLGRALGWYQQGDPVGFVMAVLGSIILLVVYRLIARRPPYPSGHAMRSLTVPPARSARPAARLRYVSDRDPGLARVRAGRGFTYRTAR